MARLQRNPSAVPWGAALSSLGGSLSRWSADRREEREKYEQAYAAQEAGAQAIGSAYEFLDAFERAAAGGPQSAGLYGPPEAPGAEARNGAPGTGLFMNDALNAEARNGLYGPPEAPGAEARNSAPGTGQIAGGTIQAHQAIAPPEAGRSFQLGPFPRGGGGQFPQGGGGLEALMGVRKDLARHAPEALDGFDKRLAIIRGERKRQAGARPLQDLLTSMVNQAYLTEERAGFFATQYQQGGDPAVIIAAVQQVQGEEVQRRAQLQLDKREGALDAALMNSEFATSWGSSAGTFVPGGTDPGNEGAYGFMKWISQTTDGWDQTRRTKFKLSFLESKDPSAFVEEFARVEELSRAQQEQLEERRRQDAGAAVAQLVAEGDEATAAALADVLVSKGKMDPSAAEHLLTGGPPGGGSRWPPRTPSDAEGTRSLEQLPDNEREIVLEQVRVLRSKYPDDAEGFRAELKGLLSKFGVEFDAKKLAAALKRNLSGASR